MDVALYARVSTTRQAEADLSIPDQLNQMRAYCHQNGMTVMHEYVEPGDSAMDDRRPIFQQMIEDASCKSRPYDAILVFARSRIFRNTMDSALYTHRLKRNGTRILSMTQPTSDNPMGFMMDNLISMMDEYSSLENAKHTSRAMKENARRGYFNGSCVPFGYEAVETDVVGHKGKKRKRLAIDEREALVVRRIYDLYLHGENGCALGLKAIAGRLNQSGTLMRGKPWLVQKVNAVLADTTYRGEYCFNMRNSRTGQVRPESEWIRTRIPAIVDDETFEAVRRVRESRDPNKQRGKAQHATSVTLLAGLIKCDHCNTSMTQASGKSGRYRYYKCSHKVSLSANACDTPNLPVKDTDELILNHLIGKVLTPERVTVILRAWLAEQGRRAVAANDAMEHLQKALKAADDGLNNLYGAIEKGIVTLDSTFQARVNRVKDERERILAQMTEARRETPSALHVAPTQVAFACDRMRAMLMDREKGYGKQLLRLLVKEIQVKASGIKITGRTGDLEGVIEELNAGGGLKVPTLAVPGAPRSRWMVWRLCPHRAQNNKSSSSTPLSMGWTPPPEYSGALPH